MGIRILAAKFTAGSPHEIWMGRANPYNPRPNSAENKPLGAAVKKKQSFFEVKAAFSIHEASTQYTRVDFQSELLTDFPSNESIIGLMTVDAFFILCDFVPTFGASKKLSPT